MAALGLLLGLTGLLLAARWLVRRGLAAPRVAERGNPGDFGLPFRTVSFPTANGRTLRGWFIPADHAPATAVAVLHGWGGECRDDAAARRAAAPPGPRRAAVRRALPVA